MNKDGADEVFIFLLVFSILVLVIGLVITIGIPAFKDNIIDPIINKTMPHKNVEVSCLPNIIYWKKDGTSVLTLDSGESVEMIVEGEDCDGEIINFKLHDFETGARSSLGQSGFVDGKFVKSWIARSGTFYFSVEFQEDIEIGRSSILTVEGEEIEEQDNETIPGNWTLISSECVDFNMQWSADPREVSEPRINFAQYGFSNKIVGLNPAGYYPKFEKDEVTNTANPVNGGIPQNMNLDSHLQQVRNSVIRERDDKYMDSEVLEYIMFDYESWSPVWDMLSNWTFRDSQGNVELEIENPYKTASIERVRESHPNWTESQIVSQAKIEFEQAGKDFFLETLRAAKQEIPGIKVGFYSYPIKTYWSSHAGLCGQECDGSNDPYCNVGITSCWRDFNNQLSWLYDEVDVLMPSYYLFYPSYPDGSSSYGQGTALYSRNEHYLLSNLQEGIRIKNRFGNELIPYTWYYYHDSTVFAWTPLNQLDRSLEWEILIDNYPSVDGFIFWGNLPTSYWVQELRKELENPSQSPHNDNRPPLGEWFLEKSENYNLCVPGMSQSVSYIDLGSEIRITAHANQVNIILNRIGRSDELVANSLIDRFEWDVNADGVIENIGNVLVIPYSSNQDRFLVRVKAYNTHGASQYIDYTFIRD